MLEETIRNTTLGLTIALSAVGFAVRSAEAEQKGDLPKPAVVTATFDPSAHGPLAEVSVSRHDPSGALRGFKPPVFDGAIPWNTETSPEQIAIMFGAIGLILGAAGGRSASKLSSKTENYSVTSSIIGGLLTAAMLGGASYSYTGGFYQKIDFETRIADVVYAEPAHFETHGKMRVGPLFRQIVMIPELSISLEVNSPSGPLVAEQRIKASFWIDSQGHIVNWHAE